MTNRTATSTPKMKTVYLSNEAGVTLAPPVARNKKKKTAKPTINIGGQRFAPLGKLSLTSAPLQGDSNSITLERTEAFHNVVTSATAGAFKVDVFPWFPGSAALNWLRNFSNSYSHYEVHKMEFTYVPIVPTTESGAVALSWFSDLRDSAPAGMPEMLATEQSLYCPVYAGTDGGTYLQRFGSPNGNVISITVPDHSIKFSDGTPKVFKVTSDTGFTNMNGVAQVGAAVTNLYSPGELNVATQGVGGAVSRTVGTIFVRYRVKLKGPIPISSQA